MPENPDDRITHRGPGTVALYLEQMGRGGRIFLALLALWFVGLFATAILIRIGALPLVASIWLVVGLLLLGGWANWRVRASKYEQSKQKDAEP